MFLAIDFSDKLGDDEHESSIDSNKENADELDQSDYSNQSTAETTNLDWNNLRWEESVGKRKDCNSMIYTLDEQQLYGKNRVLQNGETAYLCRLYHTKRCKSRLYMKDGRLYRHDDFIPHNHQSQEFYHSECQIEKKIKDECGNLDVLVNARTQSSAVADIFDKHMKQ